MDIDETILSGSEKLIFGLRELYASRGFVPYRMSKFEEYDLYAGNKEFLISDNVITFTDTDGKLMALKPDVTLSIVKNTPDDPRVTKKVYYNENVYRVSGRSGQFREMMQSGVECIGKVTAEETADVIMLASDALMKVSPDSVLSISWPLVFRGILMSGSPAAGSEEELYAAAAGKNADGAERICAAAGVAAGYREALRGLLSFRQPVPAAIPALEALGLPDGLIPPEFTELLSILAKRDRNCRITVDFSVTGDMNYYSGVVFKGFVGGIPSAVLSGGRYEGLMRRMQRRSNAVGFAVYIDVIERSGASEGLSRGGWINVALPKGRLGENVYSLFAQAGYECPSILEPNRRLVFENPERMVRYFWVKPSDVPVYVERGAADVGVAGKDILLEHSPDVYELLDLGVGVCRMAVAGPKDFTDGGEGTLRVATKFAAVAGRYYQSRGRDIDIIPLNGSIELAPLLGLSDVIVDIVETGATLRENGLEVKEEIFPISARLIANKAAYQSGGSGPIEAMKAALAGVCGK